MTETLPWELPGWRESADAWIAAQLNQLGLRLEAPIDVVHATVWSRVLGVPTNAGKLFFKHCFPSLHFEIPLTDWLAKRRPDCIPEVLAADEAQGFMLMTDAGEMLRKLIRADHQQYRLFYEAIDLYAGLQQELIPEQAGLLATGIPDRRMDRLTDQYRCLLEDRQQMRIGAPDGLSESEHAQLQEKAGWLENACAFLASAGIPDTLHHDDFHDANIFLRGGRIILSDWGDSALTHPFLTMTIFQRVLAWNIFDSSLDAPEVVDLRRHYLSRWVGYASLDELDELYRVANEVGKAARALTYYMAIPLLPEPYYSENAERLTGWLKIFLGVEE